MARPPLPVGIAGRISAQRLPDGPKGEARWVAVCRYRDADGVTRRIKRHTPDGMDDPKGEKTELILKAAVRDRPATIAAADALSGDTKVSALWERYRSTLVDSHRSAATLESYERMAKPILADMGALRVREVSTQRLDGFLREIATRRGQPTAKTARTVLTGMFKLAVRLGALTTNPVREVGELPGGRKKRRAKSLDAGALAALLSDVRTSKIACPVVLVESQVKKGMKPTSKPGQIPTVAAFCAASDLADVITLFAATGCRIGELMGVRWADVDLDAKTLSVTGQVVRERGVGLIRQDWAKTPTSIRTVALPGFAVDMLKARERSGEMVFASKVGTLRDPDTVARQWRQVRAALDLEWVTSHTFRKTVATILDEEGLSARQAADQLGHAQVSMTQDVYLGRGRTHKEAADALDRSIAAGGESVP